MKESPYNIETAGGVRALIEHFGGVCTDRIIDSHPGGLIHHRIVLETYRFPTWEITVKVDVLLGSLVDYAVIQERRCITSRNEISVTWKMPQAHAVVIEWVRK